ncbi:BON domain-containing protein [Dyadobacter luteus]|nr:BON domain-containing protein [Dyadobacter luteus]
MRRNEEIQKDVEEILNGGSFPNSAEFIVEAKDGVVTLSGVVDKLVQKLDAETVAKLVPGVIVLIEQIKVRDEETIAGWRHEYKSIKTAGISQMQDIHFKKIENKVTLTGTVGSLYEKEEATRQAWKTQGVEIVFNELVVAP